MRLDVYLTEKGLFESRSKARQAIESGFVRVNGEVVMKSSCLVGDSDAVEAKSGALQYVGRGGKKLEKAILQFGLDFSGATVLDVGASTGGFTDCALQHGAAQVYAVDVGQAQLHPSLASDERVLNWENTDIRQLPSDRIPGGADAVLVDVSFISLRHIFPVLQPFIKPGGFLVALVKPQFEQPGRRRFRGGIIKDPEIREGVLENVRRYAESSGLAVVDVCETEPDDEKRNIELLMLLKPISEV